MQPLYQAIAGKPKQLQWTEDSTTSFNRKKEALANATILTYPQANAPLAVTVNASGVAVHAVLKQFVIDTWQPLAFFNKSLWPAKRKYSTFDREILAFYLCARLFHYFLEGRKFTAFRDHKPLMLAFAKISELWSAQQQLHLAAISKYTTCIKHILCIRKEQPCCKCTVMSHHQFCAHPQTGDRLHCHGCSSTRWPRDGHTCNFRLRAMVSGHQTWP